MTLQEMGALLRQERERQGISLEKAAADIKISKKYLIALEDGQTGELPHPVYAKGFVKNYARLLGLDPEEMGAALSRHYAVDEDQLRDAPRHEPREAAPIRERKASAPKAPRQPRGEGGLRPSLAMAVPLLLLLGGLVWFFGFSSLGQGFNLDTVMVFIKEKLESSQPVPAPEPQKAAKPAPAQPAPKPEAKPEPKPEPRPEPSAQPAAPPQAQQADPAQVQRDLLATGSGPAQPAAQAEPALTAEKLADDAKFAAQGRQVVEINALQPATVDVSTEDGRRRAFTLVKGQRLSLKFNERVVVRFQQAPSVSVKLNGKDYPLEGGRADGKSITFP